MKKNKGITLIALILTIVIMLILLAVGASYIINDNLIGRADNTVKAANNKINQQQTKVDDLMGEFDKYSVAHDWHYTDKTRAAIKCVCDDCKEAANSTEGRILYIGQQIMYTSTGTGSSSITAEKAGGYVGTTGVLKNQLKVASTKLNGNMLMAALNRADSEQPTTTQTITADSDTKWVVLGYDDKNNDGINETLLLTTLEPTTGKIILYGEAAYNNVIEEVNRMCKELYGNDARGMTLEDSTRAMGFTDVTLRKVNTYPSWEDYISEDTDKTYYTPAHPDGIQDGGTELGNYEVNDSDSLCKKGTLTNIANTSKNLIFGLNGDYGYWLAAQGGEVQVILSSSLGEDSTSFSVTFGPSTVKNGRLSLSNQTFECAVGTKTAISLSLRGVVSITSQIPDVGEILVSSDAGETGSEGGENGGLLS